MQESDTLIPVFFTRIGLHIMSPKLSGTVAQLSGKIEVCAG